MPGRRKKLAIAAFVLAALSLVAAIYFYLWAVPVEFACHQGDPAWCAELSRTLARSVGCIVFAVVLTATGLLLRFLRPRRATSSSAP